MSSVRYAIVLSNCAACVHYFFTCMQPTISVCTIAATRYDTPNSVTDNHKPYDSVTTPLIQLKKTLKYLHGFPHLVCNLISRDGGLGHLAPLPCPDVQPSLGVRIGDCFVPMHVHGRSEPCQRSMVCVPATPVLFFLVFVVVAAVIFLVAAAAGRGRVGKGSVSRVAIVDAIADVGNICVASELDGFWREIMQQPTLQCITATVCSSLSDGMASLSHVCSCNAKAHAR